MIAHMTVLDGVVGAFSRLYPDCPDVTIYYTDTMDEEEHSGSTSWLEDGSYLLQINANISVLEAMETLVHELAHIHLNNFVDHDELWKDIISTTMREFEVTL